MSSQPGGLLIVPIAPAPSGNGLAMRAALTLQGMARVCNVTTLVVPVSAPAVDEHDLTWAAERSEHCVLARLLNPIDAARVWVANPVGRAMIAATQPLPRRARLADPDTTLRALGDDEFDLVWTMRLYLAPVAHAYRRGAARMVLDIDEDDAVTCRAIAELHQRRGEFDLAARLAVEADAYNRFARHTLGWFDHVVTSTEVESAGVRRCYSADDVTTVPNAVDVPENYPRRSHTPRRVSLLFLGNMDYAPNLDAAERLVDSIFPALRGHLPTAELHLVGGGSAITRLTRRPGIHIHGFVPDLGLLYERSDLAVVPLRAGGGSRLKIIEAFARGVPVVATQAAAAGLDVRHGEQLLIANDDPDFVAAVMRVVTEAGLRERLTVCAHRFAAKRHDLDAIATRIADEIQSVIQR